MNHETFAQLLGNYGEFIGAIAVVVTLVFVGIQVRLSRLAISENNRLSRIDSLDESRRGFSAWRLMLAQNKDIAKLWQSGLAGEELDADQQFRFSVLLQEQQFLLNTAYDRYVEHDMRQRADSMARIMAMLWANPAVPEPVWLPGTEAFRAEVQQQRAAMEKAAHQ